MKKVLIGLLTFVLLLVAFNILFTKSILESKLTELLQERFKGYYSMTYSSLETSFNGFTFSVSLNKAKIKTDTSIADVRYPIINMTADTFQVESLVVWDVLIGNTIDIHTLKLKGVELNYSLDEMTALMDASDSISPSESTAKLQKVNLDNLVLEDLYVSYRDIKTGDLIYHADQFNASLEGLIVDLNEFEHPIRAITVESFDLNAGFTEFLPAESDYYFVMDETSYCQKEKSFDARGIGMHPHSDQLAISDKKEFKKVIPDIAVGELRLTGLDFLSSLKSESLKFDSLILSKARFDLLKNEGKDQDLGLKKPVFNQVLHKLGYPIAIGDILVQDSDLKFKAVNQGKEAILNIKDFGGSIHGVSSFYGNQDTTFVELGGLIDGTAKLEMNAQFPNDDTLKFLHTFEIKINNLKMQSFNSLLKLHVPIDFQSGTISSLHVQGRADTLKSWGYLSMYYKDLKGELLKADGQKNRFVSSLINTMIYTNNPQNNKPLRRVQFRFERQMWQDFVMLWIGGALNGMAQTMLKPPAINMLKKKKGKKKS